MHIELTTSQVADELIRTGDFGYSAARAIAEWLEELESDLGHSIPFDPVAVRCEWAEYDSLQECWDDYSHYSYNEAPTDEEILEWLHGETTALELDGGGIAVMQF